MTHATTAPCPTLGRSTPECVSPGTGIARAFNSVYQAMIRAQQARANARLRPYLARQNERTLDRLGFSGPEIAAIRASAAGRDLPWR